MPLPSSNMYSIVVPVHVDRRSGCLVHMCCLSTGGSCAWLAVGKLSLLFLRTPTPSGNTSLRRLEPSSDRTSRCGPTSHHPRTCERAHIYNMFLCLLPVTGNRSRINPEMHWRVWSSDRDRSVYYIKCFIYELRNN